MFRSPSMFGPPRMFGPPAMFGGRGVAAPAGVVSEYCLSFDGVDDWVDCGTSFPLILGDYTVAFWVKTSVASGNRCVIAQSTGGSPCTFAITIGYTGSGKVNVWNDASGVTYNSTASVADGNWHHVAVTRTGSTGNWTIKIYIDGVLDSSGTLSTNPYPVGPQVLAVGRFGGYAFFYYFSGVVDDVRIWDGTALESTDIAAIAGNTSDVTSGRDIYLDFEEGTGTTTKIYDGDGNELGDATLTNGPTYSTDVPPWLSA